MALKQLLTWGATCFIPLQPEAVLGRLVSVPFSPPPVSIPGAPGGPEAAAPEGLALVSLAFYQLEPTASRPGPGPGPAPAQKSPGTVRGHWARCLQPAVCHSAPRDRSGEVKAETVSPRWVSKSDRQAHSKDWGGKLGTPRNPSFGERRPLCSFSSEI